MLTGLIDLAAMASVKFKPRPPIRIIRLKYNYALNIMCGTVSSNLLTTQ